MSGINRTTPLTRDEMNVMRDLMERAAKKEKVSVQTLRRDIHELVQECLQCTEPYAKQFWSSLPLHGAYPTAEEALFFLILEVARQRHDAILGRSTPGPQTAFSRFQAYLPS